MWTWGLHTGSGQEGVLPACPQKYEGRRAGGATPQAWAGVRRRKAGLGGGRRAGAWLERRWAGVEEEPAPGRELVGSLQGFVLVFSTRASLAPGPKRALALSKSLVNG